LTYIVKGELNHEDSTFKAGILKEGVVQWMVAGKSVLHSELPNSFDEYTNNF
jgi:redox-sensitive bicupin YhaK (pirin superfamily)